MKIKGFTLTEVVIALLVSGIIILTIGIISQISTDSYMNLRREAELYNEIYSGFDLVERSVRRANATLALDTSANTLTTDDRTFRAKGGRDFIYTDSAGDHIILANASNLTFIPSLTNGTLVTVNLAGEKDKTPFNLTINVTRRN